MRGLILNPPGEAEERENWRLVGDMVDELYFRREYRAGLGRYDVGAAVAMNSRGAVVSFPNAGNPSWRLVERRAERWRRAGIHAKLAYTVDAAGGGDFYFRLNILNFDAGDNLATIAQTTLNLAIASPAANSDVLTAELVDTTSTIIPGNKGWVIFLLQRISADAADTSANALQILSLDIRVLPQGG